jgi:hypothetical protein
MTKDTVNTLTKASEQYSRDFIDLDDAFVTGTLAEFAGVKRYFINKIMFTFGCKLRDFCFMFNTSVLMLTNCKAKDMIKIWYKWQNTTLSSCKKQ